jgi:hypothetical protein
MILDAEDIPEDVMDAVRGRLRDMAEAELAVAEERQRKLAEWHAKMQTAEARTIDGVGQLILRITPEAYHYWGRRLGYECWGDGQFKKEFARDNEAARVKYTPRTATILHPGLPS